MRIIKVLFMALCLLFIFPGTSLAKEGMTPSQVPMSDLERFVDDYVDEYIGQTTAGAAVVILKDQKIVLSKGYGYADLENQIAMDAGSTVLEWGSISKLFVWTAVMQQVELGNIDLHADIRTYLPEGFMTRLQYNKPITMLNLMHHNAGFDEYVFDLGYATPDLVKPLAEGLQVSEPAQVFKPGEVVAYSNYSTSLAAYIVERITGQSYDNYLNEEIFSRLSMQHSTTKPTFDGRPDLIEQKAKGYVLTDTAKFEEGPMFYMSMYPSGGINGTAEDLAMFANALMPADGKTPSLFEGNRTLQEMLSTSYSPADHVPGIAHGFWEYDGAYRGLMHGGNTTTFSSQFHIVPDENFAVIVLTNQAGEANISYGLTKALVGESDKTVLSDDLPDPKQLEGNYLAARRTHDGFINLYFYLIPLTITAAGDNEFELQQGGLTANYIQTSPYVYKMTDGSIAFDPMSTLYFDVKDGQIQQISTSYSDYLPVSESTTFLFANAILALLSVVYFIISPIVLLIKAIINRMKKRSSSPLPKWNVALNVTMTAILVNNLILAIRMLANSTGAYTAIKIHFIVNYGLTILSFASIIFVILHWRKDVTTKVQKVFYLLSIVMSLILLYLLIFWQFYR